MPQSELNFVSGLPHITAESGERAAVLSGHIRLARNFRRFPFPGRAGADELEAVTEAGVSLQRDLEEALGEKMHCLWIEKLTPVERDMLMEQNLITPILCQNPRHRAALISADRKVSVMINEDDHLRIQVADSGFDLDTPLKKANMIDDLAESRFDLAFDAKMGYLTACPTNLGTGLRASVLLHLPALAFTQGVDNIINITQQLGLSMRAVYVGGKQGQQYGNIFQVANQLTLGFSEEEIIANLKSAVGEIVSYENKARQVLKSYRGSKIEDMVWRAFGVLRYARLLGEGEALDLFSKVRLGIDLGFIVGVRADFFGEAILACQECFLKQKTGRENMSSGELEKMRGLTARKLLHKYMKLKDEREEKDRESNVEPKTANETANEGENK